MKTLEEECREWLSRRMKSSAYAPFDVVVSLMTKFSAKVAEKKGTEIFIVLDLESSPKNMVYGVYTTLKESEDAQKTLQGTNLSDESAVIITEHIR
jgi:hypothetical protein